jgi:hypothetical protein
LVSIGLMFLGAAITVIPLPRRALRIRAAVGLFGAAVDMFLLAIIPPPTFWYLFWIVPVSFSLWLVWSWDPFRKKVPFDLRSPVVSHHRSLNAIPSITEMGLLDFELAFSKARKRMIRELKRMSKTLNNYSHPLSHHASRIEAMNTSSIRRRFRAYKATARMIRNYSQALAQHEQTYRIQVERFTENGRQWLERTLPVGGMQVLVSAEMLRAVIELREKSRTHGRSIERVRSLSASQSINAALDELLPIVRRITDDANVMATFLDWVIQQLPPSSEDAGTMGDHDQADT